MTTDAFDAALSGLRIERDVWAEKLEEAYGLAEELRHRLEKLDFGIEQFVRAKEFLSLPNEADNMPATTPQQPPERHSVQRTVMALFEAPNARIFEPAIAEATIIKRTNLPEASVHAFLLRAVLAGKLLVEDGWYRLPLTSDVPYRELYMRRDGDYRDAVDGDF